MKPKYRIIKHTYYEKCDVRRETYTIQIQKRFWKWLWWKDIKITDCGWGDCYDTNMEFNSESEAIYAIKKLQNGHLPDGWTKEVSAVLDFNRENK